MVPVHVNGLRAFEFTFRPYRCQSYRLTWIRFYASPSDAWADIADVLAREYPTAQLESIMEVR